MTRADNPSVPDRGMTRALQYRTALLRQLNAEPQVVRSSGDQSRVQWSASGLDTFLTVQSPSSEQPFHCPFVVRTYLVGVTDHEAARYWVNEMNTYTSLTRWLLIDNSESEERYGGVGEFSHLVVADYSTLLGNPVTEVPFRVAEMIIREQITKSWVLVSNDFAQGWGESLLNENSSSLSIDEAELDVNADYFDLYISPRSEDDASALMTAANEAFRRELQAQLISGESGWLGFEGLTFEVPFGLGDFNGVVTMLSNGGDERNDTRTALVRASETNHPHLGSGLICSLQIPEMGSEANFKLVEQLNKQNAYLANPGMPPESLPFFSHSIGAWVVRGDDIAWAAFVPAAFETLVDPESLIDFFREMWQNAARISFAALAILEWENFEQAGLNGEMGLLAGRKKSRGGTFGEIGGGDHWHEEKHSTSD